MYLETDIFKEEEDQRMTSSIKNKAREVYDNIEIIKIREIDLMKEEEEVLKQSPDAAIQEARDQRAFICEQ